MRVRAATSADAAAIDRLLRGAFAGSDEAELVVDLRARGEVAFEFVAELDGMVVGQVLASPLRPPHGPAALGLAPLAVAPEWQRRGIGSGLMRALLAAMRDREVPFVVLLGSPTYYARFGFRDAGLVGCHSEFGGGPEFQMLLLDEARQPPGALVRYSVAFDRFRGA
jgi:putative acetyltransferase